LDPRPRPSLESEGEAVSYELGTSVGPTAGATLPCDRGVARYPASERKGNDVKVFQDVFLKVKVTAWPESAFRFPVRVQAENVSIHSKP